MYKQDMEPIMAETTTITVRIPVELKEKLDRLSDVTKRSRSYLAAEALAGYAESELAIVEGLTEGMADFEAGRYFTHEEVVAESEKLFAELHERETKPVAGTVRGERATRR